MHYPVTLKTNYDRQAETTNNTQNRAYSRVKYRIICCHRVSLQRWTLSFITCTSDKTDKSVSLSRLWSQNPNANKNNKTYGGVLIWSLATKNRCFDALNVTKLSKNQLYMRSTSQFFTFIKIRKVLACRGLCASGFFLMYAILDAIA